MTKLSDLLLKAADFDIQFMLKDANGDVLAVQRRVEREITKLIRAIQPVLDAAESIQECEQENKSVVELWEAIAKAREDLK